MKERRRSLAIIFLAWLILQLGGIFSPGLLDDVDSVYIEIAREMLHRHDFVTPYIDGIRFFDKPPLMYWLASSSMAIFGEKDWAARIPIALAVLALFLAIYNLGRFLYRHAANQERAAFYAALIFATSIGPYLYTRFFIPDILTCLWLTLGIHAFLLAADRLTTNPVPHLREAKVGNRASDPSSARALLPCLAFAATLALNLLTKGFIGLVFPLAFVFLYLALARFKSKRKVILSEGATAPQSKDPHNPQPTPALRPSQPRSLVILLASATTFLTIALPWHILAALRNPPIPMPPGLGLPARAGWAWFYLYNEHIARFLQRRIPHDYGQTPIWLFWLYALIWIMPWATFLPALFSLKPSSPEGCHPSRSGGPAFVYSPLLPPTLWALIVLIFFTLSARQEYYSLPALPALALLLGYLLATADRVPHDHRAAGEVIVGLRTSPSSQRTTNPILTCHRFLLLPLASLIAVTCLYFAAIAPHPAPGSDLSSLLASNPELYNLSLGHIFDLTGAAMGFFRGPLLAVTFGMAILGPVSYILRRRTYTYAANLTLAAGMTLVLLAAHAGLVRFNPILGSKTLAEAIVQSQQQAAQLHPHPSLILLDGELTSGSTLLFYTRQPVHLVNGRINGPWFGSFWPDSPPIFETEASLRRLWAGPDRIYLLTYTPASRTHSLTPYAPVHTLATAGGKTILTNR